MRAACRPRICLASRWNAGCAGVASGRGQHGRDDHTGALSTCTCASAMPASCDSINFQISCCSAAAGWRNELLQSRPSMISRIRDFTSLTSGLLCPPCFPFPGLLSSKWSSSRLHLFEQAPRWHAAHYCTLSHRRVVVSSGRRCTRRYMRVTHLVGAERGISRNERVQRQKSLSHRL